MNENNYTISRHAKERYAMRLLGKEDNNEIQSFVVQNEDKILNDITKMINYGELLFTGKQFTKDGKGNVLNVYLKDCWVVLVDAHTNNVVTLYKVDLGCGDEFNGEYVARMLERINEAKYALSAAKIANMEESNMYKGMIDENMAMINEYKGYIKNLEALNESYQQIIANNTLAISKADKEVASVVNALIGIKQF